MDTTDQIAQLLSRCGHPDAVLPPTALYNEGWMLRLVLDWASEHRSALLDLSFAQASQWYSEALLASRFQPRRGRDTAGEGFTHADGVIGHFRLRPSGRGDIELLADAHQLLVVEAKMASGLSAGTTRAPTFNQAARNVACIAHLVSSAGIDPSTFTSLGFVLLAPAARITEGAFAAEGARLESGRSVRGPRGRQPRGAPSPASRNFERSCWPRNRGRQVGAPKYCSASYVLWARHRSSTFSLTA